jgi:hypothetical protein
MDVTNGNQKGKAGERELSKELTRLFGNACRRGKQYCGGEDSPDVIGLPGIHLECKRTNVLRLWEAIDQAVAECGENTPLVCHRPNRPIISNKQS